MYLIGRNIVLLYLSERGFACVAFSRLLNLAIRNIIRNDIKFFISKKYRNTTNINSKKQIIFKTSTQYRKFNDFLLPEHKINHNFNIFTRNVDRNTQINCTQTIGSKS